MDTMKRRPLPHVAFEYYFYVQLVCPDTDAPACCAALCDALQNLCRTLRSLGVFETGPDETPL